MLKVGYLAPVNPEVDRMAWSGTYYNTYHAIKKCWCRCKMDSIRKSRHFV